MARSQRSHATSAALGGRQLFEQAPVEALLAGESLDTSRLSYDFDGEHVAVAAAGPAAEAFIRSRPVADGSGHLAVEARSGIVWGWFGGGSGIGQAELEAILPGPVEMETLRRSGTKVGVGEPAAALVGWRLTHGQAVAALSVARLVDRSSVARYAEVALLASVLKDNLLASSLHHLYLEPLQGGPRGGEELRNTLRAYFAAGRNLSAAGDAIGVTRQAVARRLRDAEARLGRQLAACGPELEVALQFDALDATPTPLSAP